MGSGGEEGVEIKRREEIKITKLRVPEFPLVLSLSPRGEGGVRGVLNIWTWVIGIGLLDLINEDFNEL